MKLSKTLIFTFTFGVIIIQLTTVIPAQPSSYKDFGLRRPEPCSSSDARSSGATGSAEATGGTRMATARGQAAYSSLKLGTDSTSTRHTVASHSTLKSVTLFNAGDYLMLECKLNGKPAYFMIDTGASYTVLHSRSAKQYDFQLVARKGQQTTGFGGSSSAVAIAIGAKLDLGGTDISMGFLAQDLTKLNRQVQKDSNVRIAGIIGTDLLKLLQCQLNVGNKSMIF